MRPMRGGGHDRINTCLPDELIVEVFRRLDSKPSHDSSSLVCKRWLALERRSRTSLRIGATGNPDLFVDLLSRRFVNVRHVHIDERLNISLPVHLGSAARWRGGSSSSYNKSEEDGVETNSLSDAGMVALGHGFLKLERLSLVWCSSVSSAGLTSLADKCRLLKSLDLQGCYVGDQGVAAVGQCCKQLEDLNLRFCEGLTDVCLVELASGVGKSLKSLGIAACVKITDTALEAVRLHCKSLESMSLDAESIHNKGVLAVVQGCPGLKVLKLQCINVTDEVLIAVGNCCSYVEILALYTFQRFSDKRLTELALLYCQRIGKFVLAEIGKGCKFLQALHLVDCSSIGDEAICSIAMGCRNLKKLHIRRCYEIGNKGVVAIGENCRSLTNLSLRFCDRVGDEALIAVSQCSSLQYLNVSGCHQIGNAGLIAIARGCAEITYLDVSVLQNLGDLSLAELGEGCPNLKEIVLSHCRQITDVGLNHLVKNCTMLTSCHMVYCQGITSAGVATVVSSCPNIKKVLVEK
ncbi:F-box/LRR-repeat protein 4 isoform X2 [Argentina anserina]|uniref:F-box/LRR-repeat protein 4 isoform X2 n=1 Tax=Argentina anserina TaxID=57926 RepID=UPI00217669CD|nr:F-box/LRR-repeat protein 4 isoform X2 [Potentilla anserina]